MEEDEFRRLAELVREIAEKVCKFDFTAEPAEGETDDFRWHSRQKVCSVSFGPPSFIDHDRGYHQLESRGCRRVTASSVRLLCEPDVIIDVGWQEIFNDREWEGITRFVVQGMSPDDLLIQAIVWKLKYL